MSWRSHICWQEVAVLMQSAQEFRREVQQRQYLLEVAVLMQSAQEFRRAIQQRQYLQAEAVLM
jgi:hypothetical protein